MRLRGDYTGINNRRDEVFNKTAFVSRFAAKLAKIIFPIGQWANPDEILNQKTPCERRKMEFPHPAPAQNQKSAENRKKHEAEMNYKS